MSLTHRSRSPYQPSATKYYQDSYSHLESPDKINSLERTKKSSPLLSAINDLDQAVYGGTNSYGRTNAGYGTTTSPYGQNYQSSPVGGYTTSPSPYSGQTPQPYSYETYSQARGSPKPNISSPTYKTPSFGTGTFQSSLNAPKSYGTTTNTSPKPFSTSPQPPPVPSYPESYTRTDQKSTGSPQPGYQSTSSESYVRSEQQQKPGSAFDRYSTTSTFKPAQVSLGGGDGLTKSEYSTNTYKTPEGYRTDTYKYEYYKSEPKTTYSSASEKYYTTTNVKDGLGNVISSIQAPLSPKDVFQTFKNGGTDEQYQSSYSSNVEYINEPPILKDDCLEQKSIKKSMTEQVFEKKTTTTTKSTKQESQLKSFKFP